MSPSAEKKSWFARHKILTATLVIIALIIIGNALGGDDSESQPESTSSATSAEASNTDDPDTSSGEDNAEEEPASEEAPTAGLGQAVDAGDFTVTVTNVESGVARVGDEYFGEDASGQFVIIDVDVTNTQNEAKYFFDDDITLVDDQGRKHSSSSHAWVLENNILMEEINPGVSQSGQILFDIPADAVPTAVSIDSGFFSSPVEVTLK